MTRRDRLTVATLSMTQAPQSSAESQRDCR
jgi:hypothetical protein